MKLIRCYIENFGGLSQYALEFDDQITVIQAPNGFGKTTLAEFLRAMFYGFPRKAKALEKSKRQKYTPWNGGRFGGNLVFESDGNLYRLERTFGATPRSDTFQLIDLNTGKKSSRFSEDIGLELFQLDADSFERSTYMPQIRDFDSLTTAGIQAKLGDLVEDTDDLGNFDKAMAALKTARSRFVPYRGSGGSVAEASAHITQIQQELDQEDSLRSEAEKLNFSCQARSQQRLQISRNLADTRQKISRAAENAVYTERRRQYDGLLAQLTDVEKELELLCARYPGGIPSEDILNQMQQLSDEMRLLSAQIPDPTGDQADIFLKENASRFASHLPTEQELSQAEQQRDRYAAVLAQLDASRPSAQEQQQYQRLSQACLSGQLEESRIDSLAAHHRAFFMHRAKLDSLSLSEEEQRHYGQLSHFFLPGLPAESTLDDCAQKLEKAAAMSAVSRPVQVSPLLPGFALLFLILGLGMLSLSNLWLGSAAIVAATATFILTFSLHRKAKKTQSETLLQASLLEKQVSDFVRQYTAQPVAEGLALIRANRKDFLRMEQKLQDIQTTRAAVESSVAAECATLTSALGVPESDFEDAIAQLRLARERYLDLEKKIQDANATCNKLKTEADRLESEITAFLRQYQMDSSADHFTAALSSLRHDAVRYQQADLQLQHRIQQEQPRRDRVEQLSGALAQHLAPFGLRPASDLQQQLQQLRSDRKSLEDAQTRKAQLSQQIDRIQDTLPATSEEEIWDSETLKQQEQQLTQSLSNLDQTLLQQEHLLKNLQQQLQRFPDLQDELDFWKETRENREKKAQILDSTMEFLQNAKDSLTTSYLGPIRQSFHTYLQRLTQQENQQAIISPDLEIQLEQGGLARELGYFSAGQADTLLLCMRLALVDALFTQEKPFIILDDPFINLDDRRVQEALNLLKNLGQDRQIIYLTCSSSRSW